MKNTPMRHYHMVLENGRKILISDCIRILEYSPEKIKILLHSGKVILSGRDLAMSDFFGDEIQICGIIENICLQGEKSEKQE